MVRAQRTGGRMIRLPDLREEEGFTLIELMVVVAILGVLLLMSTSTFIGVKERANDSAAKQTAAQALETGRIVFTDHATYGTVTPAELSAAEPSLNFVDEVTNSSGPNNASMWVPDAPTLGPHVRGGGLQRLGQMLLHPGLDHDRHRLRRAGRRRSARLHRRPSHGGHLRHSLARQLTLGLVAPQG